jgi:hypothetical protein
MEDWMETSGAISLRKESEKLKIVFSIDLHKVN